MLYKARLMNKYCNCKDIYFTEPKDYLKLLEIADRQPSTQVIYIFDNESRDLLAEFVKKSDTTTPTLNGWTETLGMWKL